MGYIERTLGDSADKHEKSIEAVGVANGKHANDLKAVRDLMQSEKDKRDVHHASVEERILFLERAIGESGQARKRIRGNQRLACEAERHAQIAHWQACIYRRSLGLH